MAESLAKGLPLYRLVYVSRNTIEGGNDAVRAEVDKILAAARSNNPRLGVTGALMFNSGCFAQVLEGAHDAVQQVFERIQCDLRHCDVTVLGFDEIPEAAFPNWSMAYVGRRLSSVQEFAEIAIRSGFDASRLSSDNVFRLLQSHLLEAEAQ